MRYSTTVGVDLAKNVIQISVVSGRGKELVNRALTRKTFAEFLGKQKPSLVAFETCATAHYWACRSAARARSADHSSQGGGAIPAGPQDG
jgi:transposase